MKKKRFENVTEMEKIPAPSRHEEFDLKELNNKELEPEMLEELEVVEQATPSLSDLNSMPLEEPKINFVAQPKVVQKHSLDDLNSRELDDEPKQEKPKKR